MVIRLASYKDIEGIASVHIRCWRETYKGIVLDEILNGFHMSQKIEQWKSILNSVDGKTWVVTTEHGDVIGFAHFCKERTGKYGVDGELSSIYILKSFHRKGIGRALLREGIDYLLSVGYKSMLVWSLVENSNKLFYESFDPVEMDRQTLNIGGRDHIEVAYGWRDLSFLQAMIG